MAVKKRHWFWNLLMVITVIVCISALVMHYKNWIQTKPDKVQILSGFYNINVPYAEMDSVMFVEKIPPMQRLFVDNISQQKIKVVYKDSLKLYVNRKDSLRTLELFDFLKGKLENEVLPN